MLDQADILKSRAFPTAMILPLGFPATNDGLAMGVRHFTERYGKPVVFYIKADNYVDVGTVAALAKDGLLSAIKYGTVRSDPANDRSCGHCSTSSTSTWWSAELASGLPSRISVNSACAPSRRAACALRLADRRRCWGC